MNTYIENSSHCWYLMTLLVVIALWSQSTNIVRAYRSKRQERVKSAWLWGTVVVGISIFIYLLVLYIVPSFLEDAPHEQSLAFKLTNNEIFHQQVLITIQDIVFLFIVLLSPISELHKAIKSKKRLLIKQATRQLAIECCLGILIYVIAYVCAPSLLFGSYC